MIAASQTLRVASRSGSRLIRYERQLIEVRRPAHEGLEAASYQTEPGEKNQDEPQRPCSTPLRGGQGQLDLSRSILTLSQTHRISIEERPTGHLSPTNGSGICREVGSEVVECHMRALPTPSANDGSGFHTNIPVASSLSLTLEPSRQVSSTQPLWPWKPRMG